jgi:hypothetical protein
MFEICRAAVRNTYRRYPVVRLGNEGLRIRFERIACWTCSVDRSKIGLIGGADVGKGGVCTCL